MADWKSSTNAVRTDAVRQGAPRHVSFIATRHEPVIQLTFPHSLHLHLLRLALHTAPQLKASHFNVQRPTTARAPAYPGAECHSCKTSWRGKSCVVSRVPIPIFTCIYACDVPASYGGQRQG